MDQGLNNKRVIITAGAAGLGRAIAEAFVAAGARVHVCDVDGDALDEVRTAVPDVGTTLADVADPAQVDRLFDDAQAHLGGLDVLINNAGIAGPTGPVETLTPEDFRRTLEINVDGQFLCARRAVPIMKQASAGSIVNISSTAGLFGFPLRSPYAASKWAVIGFTKTLAVELGAFGIRVNAICPGPIEGPRIDRVIAAKAEARGVSFDQVHDEFARQSSMRTFVRAGEVADSVLFLCSDAAGKVSGQVLAVDGHTESLSV